MQAATIKDGHIEWHKVPVEYDQPGVDEVTIRIAYAGANRADVMQVAGHYPPPAGASDIPGLECSGIITAVGSNVEQFAVGQKVVALLAAGAYAEFVTVSQRQVLALPNNWTLQMGAGWLETFATAYLNLFMIAQLGPSEHVFTYGGASGIGTAAIQLCHEHGNPVFVSVSSDSKIELCQRLGATKVFNRNHADLVNELNQRGGIDVVLNPVAGDSVEDNQRFLREDGRIVIIGLMGGRHSNVDFARLLMKRQRIIGSTLRSLSAAKKGLILQQMWQQFGEAFDAGHMQPVIDKVFTVTHINDALDYLRDNKTHGKALIKIASLE